VQVAVAAGQLAGFTQTPWAQVKSEQQLLPLLPHGSPSVRQEQWVSLVQYPWQQKASGQERSAEHSFPKGAWVGAHLSQPSKAAAIRSMGASSCGRHVPIGASRNAKQLIELSV
jgi:hypothetical protein